MSTKTFLLFVAILFGVQFTFGQNPRNDLRPPYLGDSNLQSSNTKFNNLLYVPKENVNLTKANLKSKNYLDSVLKDYCDFQYKTVNSLGFISYKGKKIDDNLSQNFSFYETTMEIINPKGIMIRLAIELDSNFQVIQTSSLFENDKISKLCNIISWEKVMSVITETDVNFFKIARHTNLVYNEKTDQFLYKIITSQKVKKRILRKGYNIITTQMWIDALSGQVVFYGKQKGYRKYLANW